MCRQSGRAKELTDFYNEAEEAIKLAWHGAPDGEKHDADQAIKNGLDIM